jgi:Zn-dependent protease/CBS domain-containing protein
VVKGNFTLGKVFGIRLQIHYTWFVIFVLVTYSLILYPSEFFHPLHTRIVLGILASILFFASIIAHELAHSIVAVRNQIPVQQITLFVFGGVSYITREVTRPKVEIAITIVGPLTSLAISGVFYGMHFLLWEGDQSLAANLMYWLGTANLILALFNLIPGFPLDGGRILRALIWHKTQDYYGATRITTRIGQGIAYVFIATGIVVVCVFHLWLNGLWLIFIGWFLHDAARAGYYQLLLRRCLHGIRASQITEYDCSFITPDLSVMDLMQQYVLTQGQVCFFVSEGDQVKGMVTLEQIRKVPRQRWTATAVKDIMIPEKALRTVQVQQQVSDILQMMNEKGTEYIAVKEGEKFVGIISRDNLHRFVRIQAEFGVASKNG